MGRPFDRTPVRAAPCACFLLGGVVRLDLTQASAGRDPLPVSSTGHLILGGELLGFNDESSVAFKIAIQLGAILAVVVAYWRRFLSVAVGAARGEAAALLFIRNIVLAFLPALLIGVIAYEAIRAAIQTPMVVAVALIVGGVAILLIERTVRKVRVTRIEEISIRSAAAVGRLPSEGEVFLIGGYVVEVIDMDGPRIDKLLFRKAPRADGGAVMDSISA